MKLPEWSQSLHENLIPVVMVAGYFVVPIIVLVWATLSISRRQYAHRSELLPAMGGLTALTVVGFVFLNLPKVQNAFIFFSPVATIAAIPVVAILLAGETGGRWERGLRFTFVGLCLVGACFSFKNWIWPVLPAIRANVSRQSADAPADVRRTVELFRRISEDDRTRNMGTYVPMNHVYWLTPPSGYHPTSTDFEPRGIGYNFRLQRALMIPLFAKRPALFALPYEYRTYKYFGFWVYDRDDFASSKVEVVSLERLEQEARRQGLEGFVWVNDDDYEIYPNPRR
jgi:hypothetical protein